MQTLDLGSWRIEYDAAATRAAYAGLMQGSAEACGCVDCRNYLALREVAHPPEALRLFETLGIDSRREAEVYQDGQPRQGVYLYKGWFHLAGRVLARGEAWAAGGGEYRLRFDEQAARIPEGFAPPVVQIEFQVALPWAIAEPPTPEALLADAEGLDPDAFVL